MNAFSSRSTPARRQAGLTIVEMVGMTVILGVIASLACPAISGLHQAGTDQQAIGIAQALNQAQQTYSLRVSGAATSWAAAPDDESKYELIARYVPFAAPTLALYEPAGYSISFGANLNTLTTVNGPSGTLAY